MKYLIDTNIYIFMLENPAALSSAQLAIISNPANALLMSIGSLYEMAIKVRTGKLVFSVPFEQVAEQHRKKLNIKLIREKLSHYKRISTLPKVPDHGDPFDLLILAQAMVEGLPVLTADGKFSLYKGIQAVL
jgi:PIN domain nuclease of toxin-antitoxin system